MSSLTESRRESRFNDSIGDTLSTRCYNGVLGFAVLYGLIANYLICLNPYVKTLYTDHVVAFVIVYFILCLSGSFISARSHNWLISFMGYNMICLPIGVLVSALVSVYDGVSSDVVSQAFLMTCMITAVMVAASIAFPKFFAGLGRVLFWCLVGIIVCERVCLLFNIHQYATTWIAVVLFSLYIGYDYNRAQQYSKNLDNAIDSAIDIYLDIINLFIRLVEILGNGKHSQDGPEEE